MPVSVRKAGKGDNDIIIGIAVIIAIIVIFIKTYSHFNQQINLITCNSNMATLSDALDKYTHLNNAPLQEVINDDGSINFSALEQKRILLLKIGCPNNGKFFLKNNIVSCSIHGQNRRE